METIKFIVKYFSSRNIVFLTAFLCHGQVHRVRFAKTSADFNIQTRFLNGPEVILSPGNIHEGVVLDVRCHFSKNVLEKASNSRGFHTSYSWLMLDSSVQNFSKMNDYWEKIYLYPDADVVWAFTDKLFEVYKVKFNQPLIIIKLDLTRNSPEATFKNFWIKRPTFVSRRKNLMNVSIGAVVVVSRPQYFKGWDDLSSRHVDGNPKTTYSLMQFLKEDLNMTYNLRQVDDYGHIVSNNSYNGMIGYLQRGEIDMAITASFMRNDRWDVVDYSAEAIQLSTAIIFRQPSLSSVSNIFLLPLTTATWLSILAVLGVASLFFFLVIIIFKFNIKNPNFQYHQDVVEFTPGEIITFTVGAICQQGFHTIPKTVTLRISMFATFIFSLFVFTAYAAKIVAILQAPSNAIQTLRDLADSPMTCGIQDTTYKKVYFAESKDPETRYLYRKKILPQGESAYLNINDGVARVKKGLYAFQTERPAGYEIILKTFSQQEQCGLKEIEAYKTPTIALPLRKYSGYRELVATRLRWLRDTGIMARTQRLWIPQKPTCNDNSVGFVSVGLLDVLPAFRVLMFGMVCCIILLALECVWAKVIDRHTDKRKREKRIRRKNSPICIFNYKLM